ncbi:MAG TPA: hypothetical protein VF297_13620 [Pyrinomonadaceae bacterium]
MVLQLGTRQPSAPQGRRGIWSHTKYRYLFQVSTAAQYTFSTTVQVVSISRRLQATGARIDVGFTLAVGTPPNGNHLFVPYDLAQSGPGVYGVAGSVQLSPNQTYYLDVISGGSLRFDSFTPTNWFAYMEIICKVWLLVRYSPVGPAALTAASLPAGEGKKVVLDHSVDLADLSQIPLEGIVSTTQKRS